MDKYRLLLHEIPMVTPLEATAGPGDHFEDSVSTSVTLFTPQLYLSVQLSRTTKSPMKVYRRLTECIWTRHRCLHAYNCFQKRTRKGDRRRNYLKSGRTIKKAVLSVAQAITTDSVVFENRETKRHDKWWMRTSHTTNCSSNAQNEEDKINVDDSHMISAREVREKRGWCTSPVSYEDIVRADAPRVRTFRWSRKLS